MKIIENKTKVTKKHIMKFLGKASLQNLWVVVICAVVISLLGFTIQNGTLVYNNFFFLVAGLSSFVFYFGLIFVHVRKQTKNFLDIENEYIFSDEEIIVSGTAGGTTEKFNIKYHQIFKVSETKDCYYFFVNNFSALILSKQETCFSHGDADKLKKLLFIKLNPKQNQLKKVNSHK